jgi:hypothetical protein
MDILKILQVVSTVVIAICTTLILLWIHRNEKKDSTTAKTIACLTGLFTEYKAVMGKINNALTVSDDLFKFLKECETNDSFAEFNKVYYSEKYNDFREVHYFFELIGTMIHQEEINKYAVWHYFSFPIEFFMKTVNIRYLIILNKCLPSYAENFCLMFRFYNDEKRRNGNKWIENGKSFDLDAKEVVYYSCGYKFKKKDIYNIGSATVAANRIP